MTDTDMWFQVGQRVRLARHAAIDDDQTYHRAWCTTDGEVVEVYRYPGHVSPTLIDVKFPGRAPFPYTASELVRSPSRS